MNKTDVSVQLYTARKFKPYKDILKFISSMDIKNIELFALSDFDEKELKIYYKNSTYHQCLRILI